MTTNSTRILLAEDSRFLRKATELILVRAGYQVATASDGEEAYQLAHSNPPHLIILDMMMPKRDGLEVLRCLKGDALTSKIPVIVLTGLSQTNENRLLEAGAVAYYEKSKLIPETLVEIVRQALATHNLQENRSRVSTTVEDSMPEDVEWVATQRLGESPVLAGSDRFLPLDRVCPSCGGVRAKNAEYEQELFEQVVILNNELLAAQNALAKAYEELQKVSGTDPLTGLANRRKGTQEYEKLLALSRRQQVPICVAMVDIDHFKKINDTYGHATGDAVLTRCAHLMASSFRTEDVVVRWGGEEFLVALYDCSMQDGTVRLNLIREQFGLEKFSTEGGEPFQVTFSAGIAALTDSASSIESLTQSADKALYDAKKHGRNRIFTASAEPDVARQ